MSQHVLAQLNLFRFGVILPTEEGIKIDIGGSDLNLFVYLVGLYTVPLRVTIFD